ncbi:MAG: Do family serine endopeptidase [Bacteroidales bacterium]|nr:Do family serine endopeptidase [Bacteroidales bacterium]
MNGKKILGTIFTAILGGLIAVFVFSLFINEPEGLTAVTPNDTPFVKFTNLPANYNADQFNFTYAAENTVHAVVHVKTLTERRFYSRNPLYEWFYGEPDRRRAEPLLGFGSGVIISSDGYIVTNHHVIEDSDQIEVTLNDKRSFKVKLVGLDPSTDIALLKVDEKNLPYIRFGNSDELRLGEWVLAVGNPFNLTSTVTAGIVSAKGRNLGILSDRYKVESFIQTDAALNRGNSGGALVNIKGELVGINSAIISPTGGYAGNSFAIPVNIVKKVIDDLKEFGTVQRAILGVEITDVTDELAKEFDLDKIEGVYIANVTEGGAAENSGLKTGDIILAINGVNMNSGSELTENLSKYRPNDKVKILIKRGNKRKQFEVVLRNMEGTTNVVRPDELILGGKFVELTDKDKTRFGIDYGVKITELGEGKLKDLGLGRGVIITSINKNEIKRIGDIRNSLGSGKSLNSIEGVQPNGTLFSYEFKR